MCPDVYTPLGIPSGGGRGQLLHAYYTLWGMVERGDRLGSTPRGSRLAVLHRRRAGRGLHAAGARSKRPADHVQYLIFPGLGTDRQHRRPVSVRLLGPRQEQTAGRDGGGTGAVRPRVGHQHHRRARTRRASFQGDGIAGWRHAGRPNDVERAAAAGHTERRVLVGPYATDRR